ncbi:hypothetical protein RRG08_006430 [Elysia crispata]|uniref:Uncharacterized protein n=1 Tax=Elysia crispata TaxID=231223 RepID=A0AAE0Y0E8_9GAST|nr:hypothetical protein RRG08_006430 [Elysia crispata]
MRVESQKPKCKAIVSTPRTPSRLFPPGIIKQGCEVTLFRVRGHKGYFLRIRGHKGYFLRIRGRKGNVRRFCSHSAVARVSFSSDV